MKKTAAVLLLTASILAVPALAEANSSDVNGGMAIGSGYAGVDAAPTDGLIVQGNVGIGTTSPLSGTALNVNGVFDANSILLNGAQAPLTPGGRLTLSSSTAVMTADVTAAATVYYADYVNDLVPIYNGTNWTEYSLGGQISLALDSNSAHTGYQQSGKLFDFVIRNNSGTPQLCTGPAWMSNTVRASSIALQNGIWTNSGSWTVKCDATSSTFTCSANQCTYVGTMYATANGQTGVQCQPANASGGPTGGGYIDISNAYNRVPISCQEQDSAATWTYATNAFRYANNSSKNQISFVDGLQQVPVEGTYSIQVSNNTIGGYCAVGATLDNISTATKMYGIMTIPTATVANNWQMVVAPATYYPQLGYHSLLAQEDTASGTCSFNNFSNANEAGMMLKLNYSY